jgi:hypothetical protein
MTRRTFEQTKESLEFMEQVDKLSQPQRDHLRTVVKRIVDCYLDDKAHGVMVLGHDNEESATLLTINCNEFEAALILAKLDVFFADMNMADAPPKEKMN